MTLVRMAIAAVLLIAPAAAFAGTDETRAAPAPSMVQQVASAVQSDPAVASDAAHEPESEVLVRAVATPPSGPTKPREGRRAKLTALRTAPEPRPLACSGYWCGRHIVLMLGVGY
jgi:hypothetical protein